MTRFIVFFSVLTSCYSPDARDCTVQCTAADSCTDGQVCGSDGYCAAPDVAGHCNGGSSVDAGPTIVSLKVTIDGPGKVAVDGIGECKSDGDVQSCMYSVPGNVARDLKANPLSEHTFVGWTSTCVGTNVTCTITPVMALTDVTAKFQ